MKRIVLCADGTWNSPETDTPTHVMRLARGIAPEDAAGNKQVVFYDWGVGSDGDRIKGGLTGSGIDKNIMDCYRFLVHNYQPGDALYLFGFSRGAYTARSLGGFIRNCGVLKPAHAARIPEAFELYRRRPKSSSPDSPAAKAFRSSYAVADRTEIELIGVWDTVGALGIPAPFIGTLGEARYLFHDAEPSSIVRHARHAVSIDENRRDFEPTLWTEKPGIDLEQVWFPGVHSDVGGGYLDRGLGDCAALWMVREAEACGLRFAPHFIDDLQPDCAGKQHNEYTGAYRALRRSTVRRVSPKLHRCVKERLDALGDKYKSPALRKLLESVGGDWSRIEVVG
ncbi:MAG: DUF2235 domain-containing protein [Pseudomonadales bacterium]